MNKERPEGSRAKGIERIRLHRELDGTGSIANKPHSDSREVQRRLRQQAKRESKNG